MKLIQEDSLERHGEGWRFILKFSDNPYTMIYDNKDILECMRIRAIMDKRILDYLRRNIDILKTSDLGFEYVK